MTPSQIIKFIEVVRGYDPEFHVQTLEVLFRVASAHPDPLQMSVLRRRFGYSSAALSRNVALLSDVGFKAKSGMRLISVKVDPEDRRERLLSLTEKGRFLLHQTASI